MISLQVDESLGKKHKGKLICISSDDIISENFDSEKLIKMRFFTIKIHYIFSQDDPNITHTKNHISG
jgi:hypothetical protein